MSEVAGSHFSTVIRFSSSKEPGTKNISKTTTQTKMVDGKKVVTKRSLFSSHEECIGRRRRTARRWWRSRRTAFSSRVWSRRRLRRAADGAVHRREVL